MGKFLDKVGLALFKSLLDAEKLFLPGTGENSVVQKSTSYYQNKATGAQSFAHGGTNTAEGQFSHAEGNGCKATGQFSHAEGMSCIANGIGAHAEGFKTQTTHGYEHAEGQYNKSNTSTRHSVGIGSSEADRKNAFEIMSNGKMFVIGVGGYDGTNPDDAKTVQEVLTEGVTNDEIDALFGDEDYYYYY